MEIGIKTSSFDIEGYGRWGEDTYKKLKAHGFSCSNFDMADTDSLLYTEPQEKADAMLLREKELALAAGITIEQVHGPWRHPVRDFTEADRAERMAKMKKSIRAASLLGCKNWVVHPIMPCGVEEADTADAQTTWSLNLAFMRELLDTAKAYGVTICLENMPMKKFSLAKPEKILEFVKTINDESFKICLDTGHVAVFEDLRLGDEVRRLGEEIRVLHVHDNKFGKDLHLMPMFGSIDWKDFVVALREIRFDGCFSLETKLPGKLPIAIFEDMCKSLVKIAEEIISWC